MIASNFYLHDTTQSQANIFMHQTYQDMASAHLQVVDNISVATHLVTSLNTTKVI
jgi:hypothetical protein